MALQIGTRVGVAPFVRQVRAEQAQRDGQWIATVPQTQGRGQCEPTARRVPHQRIAPPLTDPAGDGHHVFEPGRERMLRREPIRDRDHPHGASDMSGDRYCDPRRTGDEAAAVGVDHGRSVGGTGHETLDPGDPPDGVWRRRRIVLAPRGVEPRPPRVDCVDRRGFWERRVRVRPSQTCFRLARSRCTADSDARPDDRHGVHLSPASRRILPVLVRLSMSR